MAGVVVAVVVVALVGCNTVLGLDETGLREHSSCEDGANAFDEDGDGITNGSDNCPGIHNQSQSNADGDAVGDACDPFPDVAGDAFDDLTYFERDFGCWIPDLAATWSVTDGSLRAPRVASAKFKLQTTAASSMLELGFRVIDPEMYGLLRVTIAYPNDVDTCFLMMYLDYRTMDLRMDSNTDALEETSLDGTHRLTYSRNATRTSCTVDDVTVRSDAGVAAGPATITIELSNIGIEADYALTYATN